MLQDFDQLIRKIEEYYDSDRIAKANNIIVDLHPGDASYIASHLEEEYQDNYLEAIKDRSDLSEMIFLMEPEMVTSLLQKISASQIKQLFATLDPDDAAKILGFLSEELRKWVFTHMDQEATKEVETLLEYEDEVAGRIMSLDFFSIHEDDTVSEVFELLRDGHEAETVYSLYVVDRRNHLVGVCSLRELLTQPNQKFVKEFMKENVISVSDDMDKEEVAKVVERYQISAVPVVSDQNKLLGVITVDDVIHVIRSEATEDIMKMAGTTEEEMTHLSPTKAFTRRMPWLLVSFFGGMITIQTNFYFASQINQIEFLAFVTVIAGMGGNIASQSSTIVVRGLATGKILVSELWDVLFREVSVGILLGMFFGVMLGAVAQVQFSDISLIGFCVLVGMFFSMLIAATVGSLMPIIFQRFQIDPAVATGPFVSTTIDNLGLLGYFASILVILKLFI